ncbi:MAG: hypothetical protein WA913_10055, partial [Pricia sp.]
MHKTKEVRWFFRPGIERVEDWFDGLENATRQTRTDNYLKLKNDDIGVKLRDGKVEIKHRIGTRAKGCLRMNIWGHYDDFIKWSFDADQSDALFSQVLEGEYETWIPVEKERRLVQLTEANGGIVTESVSADVPFGCQVEYSQIRLNEEIWHTFGLEWFGDRCLKLDEEIVTDIFGSTELQMQQSKGY